MQATFLGYFSLVAAHNTPLQKNRRHFSQQNNNLWGWIILYQHPLNVYSVTRFGDFFHFGQLFKACGNNSFTQIAHILGSFCEDVKIFHFQVK